MSARTRILLLSFTLLFFELLCIRWIPAYVRYLSYFTNFILLASFLGIGLGILSARRPQFRFPSFPILLVALTIVVALNRFELHIASTDVLYFGSRTTGVVPAESFVLLPLIFTFVTAAFIPLARSLGTLFIRTPPLTAYTFDILGSLAGTAAFFFLSYFALTPIWWFAILGGLVLLLTARANMPWSALLLCASAGIALFLQRGTYWSPYYKITLTPAQPSGYQLDVNSIGHQSMVPWQTKEPFYRRVYELLPNTVFENALILGAGTGSDTATALAHGVKRITAVEIDPLILRLGAQLHPDQPYSDPRVRLVNDDGRVFLKNTREKFDLIIFALPDSLTLTSSMANLRLEAFDLRCPGSNLSPETNSILGNISARSFVQTGDNVMIGGFMVQGIEPKRVIIRAIGPELTQYGVPDALADPTLELYDGAGALIGSNNTWLHTIIGGIITAPQVRDILEGQSNDMGDSLV